MVELLRLLFLPGRLVASSRLIFAALLLSLLRLLLLLDLLILVRPGCGIGSLVVGIVGIVLVLLLLRLVLLIASVSAGTVVWPLLLGLLALATTLCSRRIFVDVFEIKGSLREFSSNKFGSGR